MGPARGVVRTHAHTQPWRLMPRVWANTRTTHMHALILCPVRKGGPQLPLLHGSKAKGSGVVEEAHLCKDM